MTPTKVYGSRFVPERRMNFPERLVYGKLSDLLWDGWAKAADYIESLSDAKLWRLREAVDAMGTSNCGWLPYRLKNDLLHLIDWHIKQREQVLPDGGGNTTNPTTPTEYQSR